MVQINIPNVLICCNCCPKFLVNIIDPEILNSLVLDIHRRNITIVKFRELLKKIIIVYKIYFRLLSSYLNQKNVVHCTLDEMVILKDETNIVSTFTPKL